MGRSLLAGFALSISCLVLAPLSAQETIWVPMQGNVLLDDGTPVCAMVLANGQYMFSCDGAGSYDLGIPLNEDGRIVFFSFADGFAPFSVTTDPSGSPFNVQMRITDPDSPWISISRTVECSGTDQVRITGTVESNNGEPLCAMILANGQHMFSCGDSLGYYDLTVRVDENGQVTMFGFADGFQHYTNTFATPDCSSPAPTSAAPQDPISDPNGPYIGTVGQPIIFDGSGSFDPDGGTILTYDWSFGDRNTGRGVAPSHTYAIAGTYTVSLTVVDDESVVSLPATTSASISVTGNEPPECSEAKPSASLLWPPNHDFVPVDILGITDADGDMVDVVIDSIYQDEAVDAEGSGNTAPDGRGVGTLTTEVRAERSGKGNGRVYHIDFTADDGNGGSCSGEVTVGVPLSQGKGSVPVDDGALYDSTLMP